MKMVTGSSRLMTICLMAVPGYDGLGTSDLQPVLKVTTAVPSLQSNACKYPALM